MELPDRIGRYVLSDRLGSGGFAVVLRGHDEILDAPVAVKVLASHWLDQMDIRRRFIDEARLLRRADSEHLVRVYDIGELDDGRPYFVMSYADRGTLEERFTRDPDAHDTEVVGRSTTSSGGSAHLVVSKPMPAPVALAYLEQVAKGAATLHRAGVLHRDLKPSNVLIISDVDRGSRLLVADLGLAKETAQASGLTLTAGTPGYMAPEQMLGLELSPATDVYSLGAIGYRMLTGRIPGVATSDSTDRDVHPRSREPDVPDWLDALIAASLSIDPARRPADAGEFAQLLAEHRGPDRHSPARHSPEPGPGPGSRTGPPRDVTLLDPDSDGRRPEHRTPVEDPHPTRHADPRADDRDEQPPAPGRRWRWLVALIVALLAIGGAVGGNALRWWHIPGVDRLLGTDQVTIKSWNGQIGVKVPSSWKPSAVDQRWEPGSISWSGNDALALRVRGQGGRSVFVGTATQGNQRLPQGWTFPDCQPVGDQPVTATTRTWRCDNGLTWTDAVRQVGDSQWFVQVHGTKTEADAILASLAGGTSR